MHLGVALLNTMEMGAFMAFENSTEAINFAPSVLKVFVLQSPLPVRFGLHTGEVVFSDDNVFGDGVNLVSG